VNKLNNYTRGLYMHADLCVGESQHGGQLSPVWLRHILLHLEPLLEPLALKVGEDRPRPWPLFLARRRGGGCTTRRWLIQTQVNRWRRTTGSEQRHTCSAHQAEILRWDDGGRTV